MRVTHQSQSRTQPQPTSGTAAPGLASGSAAEARRTREHNGYIEEWCPIRRRYVYQHRLVVEAHIGRLLNREEVVHHRNHDRTDNRYENLELHPSHSSHIAAHIAEGTWGGRGPRPEMRKPRRPCPVCGTMFKPGRRTRNDGTNVDVQTCSAHCGQKLRYGNRPEPAERPCPVCGRPFVSTTTACSRSCSRRLADGPLEHGSIRCYRHGCRCGPCRGANAAKGRRYRETLR